MGEGRGVDNTPVVSRCEVYAAQNFALGVLYIAMAFSRAVVEGVPVTRDDSEQLLVPLPTFPQKLKPLWTAPAGA